MTNPHPIAERLREALEEIREKDTKTFWTPGLNYATDTEQWSKRTELGPFGKIADAALRATAHQEGTEHGK